MAYSPGIGKCPVPRTDKVGKYPAIAWWGGGGGEREGGWSQLELTDTLIN